MYREISIFLMISFVLFSCSIPFFQNVILIFTKKIGDSLSNNNLGFTIELLIIQASLFIALQVIMLINKFIENKLTPKFLFYINKTIKEKLTKIKLNLIDDSEIHNKIMTVQQFLPQLGLPLLKSLVSLFQSVLAVLGMIYVLKNINVLVIILLILLSIMNLFITHIFNKLQLHIFNETSENIRLRDYFSRIFFDRDLISESRIFNLHGFFTTKWTELFWKVEIPNKRLNNQRSVLIHSIQIFINLIQLLMFILFLNTTSNSAISIGSFMLLTQAIIQIQGQANEFVAAASQIHQILIYLPSYFSLLSLPEEDVEKGVLFNGLNQNIKIENLSFKYKNASNFTLKKLNFTISKGESVAIVGRNGSGKTTLVKCMLGLYDDLKEGTVKYDDISCNEISKVSFRKNVAVLFQNFGKYPLTFEQNIRMGDVSKNNNNLDYSRSLNLSNAVSIIDTLPDGSATFISTEFNQGVELSGGQWQKTALARMYYKDADIIFLDEPTSAIDPLAENEIYKQFFEVSKGKTSIILTHRLGLCKLVDKIIVLDDGEIKEIGTHDELLENGLLYKDMYLAQSEWYTKESGSKFISTF
ncbi:ABC transporter ATP-binding protein [Paenibacillus sp. OAE614]|uniref:ABC transporter ATP-binding protein n=1 Tax=Paenibacillus sp. OAE614 TaxID=2663804 RepID=UPI0019DBF0BC